MKVLCDGIEYLCDLSGGYTKYLTIYDGNHRGALVLCELSMWPGFEQVESSAHGCVPRDVYDLWDAGRLDEVVRWAVSTLE